MKQSKALVAAAAAAPFNPRVRITPIHGNIKDPEFDLEWFQGFDIVLNALDNLGASSALARKLLLNCGPDARRHVNKMCMAANIPLVESGTAGYLGQVQPILKVKCTARIRPTPTLIVFRTKPNASTACRNQRLRPSPSVLFAPLLVNPSTASCGVKPILWGMHATIPCHTPAS